LNKVEGWQAFQKGEIDKRKYIVLDEIDVKDKVVLDIGFGRGEMLKICHERGCKKAIGIDFSIDAVEIANKYLGAFEDLYRLDFKNIDVIKENNIDIVLMFDIIEHVANKEVEIFLKNIKNKIHKDTIFYLTTPVNIKRGNYKGMHFNQWNEKKIIDLFQKYFKSIDIQKIKQDSEYKIVCKDYK
jgi:2-polyprenyl-3-methyl-5-hydroxy-6-metoxy-1,4-benzoquinol methylase